MEQKNIDQINVTFGKLRKEADGAIRKLYTDMYLQLKNTNSRDLGGEIAKLEARTLNNLMVSLIDNTKKASITEMVNNGCKSYLTQTGWTEIQKVVGVPCVELCKAKVDVVRQGDAKTEKSDPKLQKILEAFDLKKKKNRTVALSGATVTIITLFIPGWKIPTMIAAGAGVTALVVGGGGMLYNEWQKDQTISKFDRSDREKGRSDQPDLSGLITKITDSQYVHNLQIYVEWLEKVKTALIKECDKLIEM